MTHDDDYCDIESLELLEPEEISSRVDEPESNYPRILALIYSSGLSPAIISSWLRNPKVPYCLLHGALSWVYVVYFALTR